VNPVATVLVIARQTVVRLLRSRMLWLLAAGAVAGALLFLGLSRPLAREERGDEAFGLITYVTYMTFVLPFSAFYFGVQAVQGDLEDRTSVYLFARPLSRPAMLLGKWLAAAAVAAGLVVAGIVLLYAALASRPGWRGGVQPPAAMITAFAQATGLASLAYAALGTLFGAWLKRPLILGLVFLVGWEGAVANLPAHATARSFTVADSVRRLLWSAHAPRDDYRDVVLGPAGVVPDPDAIAPALAGLRFAGMVLALAAWIYARREYDARTAE
jgi:hypothetical protein